MKKAIVFVAMTLVFASPAAGGVSSVDHTVMSVPDMSASRVRRIIRELASDAFGGRAPGTIGEERTLELIIREFKSAGLRPGNGDAWLEAVPMAEFTTTSASDLLFEGPSDEIRLVEGIDLLLWTERSVPAVDVASSEAVFVGHGVTAPNKEWDDYAGVNVAGKTVLILANDPDWRSPGLEGPFGGRGMSLEGRREYKIRNAAAHGAAAAILIHDADAVGYPFGVVLSGRGQPNLELDDPALERTKPPALGAISRPAAKRLLRAAGQDLSALEQRAATPGFAAVRLGGNVSFRLDSRVRRIVSHNVVGVLPGRAVPDERVVYMGHWDHLGTCTPIAGDSICNGAFDNATGIAGMIEIARAHAKGGQTRRTLVFLATTGEESGFLGSRYHVRRPDFDAARTVAGINLDGLNVTGATRDIVAAASGRSEVDAYIRNAATAEGLVMTPDPDPENGYAYGSDHFSFHEVGVPTIFLHPGRDKVSGGVAEGNRLAADYGANRYHKPDDEFDSGWDFQGMLQTLRVNYRAGRVLAEGTDWPRWLPGGEFSRTSAEAVKP